MISTPMRRACVRALKCSIAVVVVAAIGAQASADVSEPAKPVPYLPRPIHTEGSAGAVSW
jgi:hypothetical protein